MNRFEMMTSRSEQVVNRAVEKSGTSMTGTSMIGRCQGWMYLEGFALPLPCRARP